MASHGPWKVTLTLKGSPDVCTPGGIAGDRSEMILLGGGGGGVKTFSCFEEVEVGGEGEGMWGLVVGGGGGGGRLQPFLGLETVDGALPQQRRESSRFANILFVSPTCQRRRG